MSMETLLLKNFTKPLSLSSPSQVISTGSAPAWSLLTFVTQWMCSRAQQREPKVNGWAPNCPGHHLPAQDLPTWPVTLKLFLRSSFPTCLPFSPSVSLASPPNSHALQTQTVWAVPPSTREFTGWHSGGRSHEGRQGKVPVCVRH